MHTNYLIKVGQTFRQPTKMRMKVMFPHNSPYHGIFSCMSVNDSNVYL